MRDAMMMNARHHRDSTRVSAMNSGSSVGAYGTYRHPLSACEIGPDQEEATYKF
jgi:hypothetical protein